MIEIWLAAVAILIAIPAYAYLVVRIASRGYFRSKREFTRDLVDDLQKGEMKCQ